MRAVFVSIRSILVSSRALLAPRPARRRAPQRSPSAAAMTSKTELVYFDDTYLNSVDAKVVSVAPQGEDGTFAVVLDRTVAYPAGGGQPSDGGRIVAADGGATFLVSEVKSADGSVLHLGAFEDAGAGAESLPVGVDVVVSIDPERRLLHARIHSAGHLLDVAMTNVGYGPNVLAPAKGLHGPDAAYVEYQGKVEGLDKDELMEKLAAEMNRLVEAGGKTASATMSYDDAAKACGGTLPPYIPEGSEPRVVTILENTEGCPCGGTHVADVSEIGAVAVVGVRVKKGVTRVSYTIEGMTGRGE